MEPRNDAVKDLEGKLTGCPYQVLLQEVQTWSTVWTSDCCQTEQEEAMKMLSQRLAQYPEAMQAITGNDVLEASLQFKKRTVSPDGWHPRSFALLGATGRDCIARLLTLCEKYGQWPGQCSSLMMGVHDKPAGGKRLIGWYRALFRLRCKTRTPQWKQWEDQHGSEQFLLLAKETLSSMLAGDKLPELSSQKQATESSSLLPKIC